jgi:hypothetical protein
MSDIHDLIAKLNQTLVQNNLDPIPQDQVEVEEEEIKPEPKQITAKVVCDSDNPNIGKAIVEDNVVVFYLHEGQEIREIKGDLIGQYIDEGLTEWVASKTVSVNVKSAEQRTCVFYTPSSGTITDFNAEESEYYDFDRPNVLDSTCSQTEYVKASGRANPPCGFEDIMPRCQFYIPQPWTIVKQAVLKYKDEDGVGTVTLDKTRKGFGFGVYRVVYDDNNGESKIVGVWASNEHGDATQDLAVAAFDTTIEDLAPSDIEEVELPEEVKVREKYFDYVLAK